MFRSVSGAVGHSSTDEGDLASEKGGRGEAEGKDGGEEKERVGVDGADVNVNKGCEVARTSCVLDYASNGLARTMTSTSTAWGEQTQAIDVAPVDGRLLLFWSDGRVPHQVLPAKVMDRYAVSIWYHDAQVLGARAAGS
jgi:hypothetical protein